MVRPLLCPFTFPRGDGRSSSFEEPTTWHAMGLRTEEEAEGRPCRPDCALWMDGACAFVAIARNLALQSEEEE